MHIPTRSNIPFFLLALLGFLCMDFGDTVSVKEHLYKKQCDYIRIHSRFEQH